MISINKVKGPFLLELSPFFERLEAIYDTIDKTYKRLQRIMVFNAPAVMIIVA